MFATLGQLLVSPCSSLMWQINVAPCQWHFECVAVLVLRIATRYRRPDETMCTGRALCPTSASSDRGSRHGIYSNATTGDLRLGVILLPIPRFCAGLIPWQTHRMRRVAYFAIRRFPSARAAVTRCIQSPDCQNCFKLADRWGQIEFGPAHPCEMAPSVPSTRLRPSICIATAISLGWLAIALVGDAMDRIERFALHRAASQTARRLFARLVCLS